MFHLRDLFHALLDALHHLVRRAQRTAGGGADVDKHHALVFVGHEAGLRRIHQHHQQGDTCHEESARQPTVLDEEEHDALVTVYHHVERRVERFAEAGGEVLLLRAVLVDVRFQQQRAEGGAQCQGVHGGDAYRYGHRQSELRVERPRCTGHERYGDEHRHEYQRRGDDGVRNAFHGVDARHVGRFVAHVEPCLHGLDHHDGVVHHRTDDQYQREQRDQVDTESRHRHEGERTDERHDDAHQRDQRRADVLQEDVYDEDHEQDGFEQRLHHLVDGGVEEVVAGHQLRQFHSAEEVFARLFKEVVDAVVHLRSVGACSLEEHARDAVMPVRRSAVGVAFLS